MLNGAQALALSRSRYFQYYDNGEWNSDPTSDIGRIERQNLIIAAALDKAKSTYNPLQAELPAHLGGPRLQQGQRAHSPATCFSLAERYHAFSGSELAVVHAADSRGRPRQWPATSRWSSRRRRRR